MKSLVFLLFFLTFLGSSIMVSAQKAPQYEFRGVWIATVENIDWPSMKGLSPERQKAEFINILTTHQHNGINAIVMQIRPAGDAFYPSQFEPWSEYLTGKQGVPPYPYYDPLQFMIEETHKRGMEFHAWLNPYRAVFNASRSSVAPSHLSKIHPEWFLTYGTTKYFNPGLPEVRQHMASVVKDLVTRYDLDGIHMDDYFYPYKITGREFPDEKTYRQYGHGMKKDDWRRSNCDSIIKLLYETITENSPRVKFGISPFGVWRNKDKDPDGSNTHSGPSNYDELYADILLWLKKGWIDYVAPQLYWEKGHRLCDYDTLLKWWNGHVYGKHLYIGHAVYRAGESVAWRNKNELPNEIKALRTYTTTQGSIFFSSKDLERNRNGWGDSLRINYYALPAIIPPMPWVDSIPPAIPTVDKLNNHSFNIVYKGDEKIKGFALYVLPALVDQKREYATLISIIVADKKALVDRYKTIAGKDDRLFISSIDLNNNVSEWVELK